MKNTGKKLLLFLAGMCLVYIKAHAQGDGLPGDPGAPFDGGLSIALIAGLGYGAKKLHKGRKNKESDPDNTK